MDSITASLSNLSVTASNAIGSGSSKNVATMFPLNTYFLQFTGKLGLYTGSGITYPPSHFESLVDEATYQAIWHKIRSLNLPADLLSVSFDCEDSSICYLTDSVHFITRFTTPMSKMQITEEMESYLSCFNEIAFDTYLEGDAVVYHEPDTSYELIVDDIEVIVRNYEYTKICTISTGNHWFKK